MARRKRPNDYYLAGGPSKGQTVSMDDVCAKCGYIMGEHAGSTLPHCPLDRISQFARSDYWSIRGTLFTLLPECLELPDGA